MDAQPTVGSNIHNRDVKLITNGANNNTIVESTAGKANNDINTEFIASNANINIKHITTRANNNTNIGGKAGENNDDIDVEVDIGNFGKPNNITKKEAKICECNLFYLLLLSNRSWTPKKVPLKVFTSA